MSDESQRMPAASVRPAVAADVEAMLALEQAVPTAPHWSRPHYLLCTTEHDRGQSTVSRQAFVIESEGQLLGFAAGVVVAGEGELETVVVRPHARRQGLGSTLCQAVVDWCAGEGARAVLLEVRATSAGAIALYTRLGFVACGRRPGYYHEPGDDALAMRLEL